MNKENIKSGVCPSTLQPNIEGYNRKVLMALFDGVVVSPHLDFDFKYDEITASDNDVIGKVSISGVQEKFGAVVVNGRIRLTTPEGRSTHILKPIPNNSALMARNMLPVNEHLTMQIASQVYGIHTAPNGLCFTADGSPVYITRRFDILPTGQKLPMEDFASLLEKTSSTGGKNYKYRGAYEDIAQCIKRVIGTYKIELERFFKILIFNYIFANGDAHLKNFSVIAVEGEYKLAPAYDLINTALHINDEDFALEGGLSKNLEKSDVYDRTGHPAKQDFINFGVALGLNPNRVEKIVDMFTSLPEVVMSLVGSSLLPAKLQRVYLRIVKERIARFVR